MRACQTVEVNVSCHHATSVTSGRISQLKTDGIILKCDCIVVPPALLPDILKTIHEGHLAVEKCLLRARSAVYWPGITNEVSQFVTQSAACQKHKKRTQKQQLLKPELPCRPLERLSSNLFEYRNHQYLLLYECCPA